MTGPIVDGEGDDGDQVEQPEDGPDSHAGFPQDGGGAETEQGDQCQVSTDPDAARSTAAFPGEIAG